MCIVSTCENHAQSKALFWSHCIVVHYGLLKCVKFENKFLFHFCNSSHSTNENLPYLLSGFYVWNQWKKMSCNQHKTLEQSTLLHRCRISIKIEIQIDFSVHNVSSPCVPQFRQMKKEPQLAYWLGYGQDDQGVKVQFPTWARDFSFLHNVQTGSGAHWSSYTMGTGDFPRGVKLTTHLHLVPRLRMVELFLCSPICFHGMVLN
jgi:hypothetical protein